jgi:transcriptional regulator with XRE-family HTH domain
VASLGRSVMLGGELRTLRETRGLGLVEVSEAAGISESTLKKIEAGSRYPSLRTLEALADCLHMNVVIGPAETVIDPLP